MVMPVIPKALYPLVPNVLGVPALLRSVATLADTATLGEFGISDQLSNLIGAQPVDWGVFDAFGAPIADYDSFVAFEYRNGSRLSDYPQEQGAFASYNKVANPFEGRVRLACGGNVLRRAGFLDAIEGAAQTTHLYTIVTPERTYENANIENIDYQRQVRDGASIIILDLQIREIRQSVTDAFTSPKSVSAAAPQSLGQVQGTTESPMPGVKVTTISSDGLFE